MSEKYDLYFVALHNDNSDDASDNRKALRVAMEELTRQGCRVKAMRYEVLQDHPSFNHLEPIHGTLRWNVPGDMSEQSLREVFGKSDGIIMPMEEVVKEWATKFKEQETSLPPEDIVDAIMFERMQLREDAHGAMDSEDEIRNYGAALINELIKQRIKEDRETQWNLSH